MKNEAFSNKIPCSEDFSLSNDHGGNVSEQYQYQDEMVFKAVGKLTHYLKPVVLAMTTSSGKSATVTKLLNEILTDGKRAVFLGSNLTTLAEQYCKSLSTSDPLGPKFTFSTLGEPQKTKLKIGLPQQLVNNPDNFEFLILDEAQWLWMRKGDPNSLISKALKASGYPKIILMTGTPALFNKNKDQYEILHLSYEKIPNEPIPVFSKIVVDVLKLECREDLSTCISKFLCSVRKNGDDISKFVVVARNIEEAISVKDILENQMGVGTIISTSRHDKDSSNLERFKSENYQACVTVSRVIAGWSYTELTCVLDLRSSFNITNTFQLMSRLFRVSQKNRKVEKVYFRVADNSQYNKTIKFLHLVVALLDDNIYKGFDGTNLVLKGA
ncbi:MAG: hypothetical protein KDD35_05845 [Bdellovibrionales bacterium]|nr:hypothetical protein [Bdellovibrionales bacterium]